MIDLKELERILFEKLPREVFLSLSEENFDGVQIIKATYSHPVQRHLSFKADSSLNKYVKDETKFAAERVFWKIREDLSPSYYSKMVLEDYDFLTKEGLYKLLKDLISRLDETNPFKDYENES